MLYAGIGFALAAACCNSSIDASRKAASVLVPSAALVALPALFEACLACSFIAALGGFQGIVLSSLPSGFFVVTFLSSVIQFGAKLLYQRALALAPLSLTVPYLSCTPGILVVLAYLFLGEHPSGLGIAGVCVIALGGYLLSQKSVPSSQPQPHPDLDDDKASKSSLWSWRLPAGSSPAAPRLSNLGPTRGALGATEAVASGFHHPQAASKAASRTASYVNLPTGGDLETASGAAVEQVAASTSRKKPVQGVVKCDGGVASGGEDAGGAATVALERKQLPEGSATLWGPLKTLLQQPGSLMMIGVACCWSVTASLDKMGVTYSPSIWIYIALQRICIATLSCGSLLITSPSSFVYVRTQPLTLLLIALLELLAVVFFLEAIKHLFVSYVVAIKRCSILLSVLAGGYFFRESIRSRLPYIALMMGGMCLIVLEPNSAILHQAHT